MHNLEGGVTSNRDRFLTISVPSTQRRVTFQSPSARRMSPDEGGAKFGRGGGVTSNRDRSLTISGVRIASLSSLFSFAIFLDSTNAKLEQLNGVIRGCWTKYFPLARLKSGLPSLAHQTASPSMMQDRTRR